MLNILRRVLFTAVLTIISCPVFAACPSGSTCTQYNGTVPYDATGGSTTRTPAARANDHGINILEFGADPTDTTDSTAVIQAAIDYAFTHNQAGTLVTAGNGANAVYCPAGNYKTSYPIFFDPPGNLRGGNAYNSGKSYAIGDIVIYSSTLYVSLVATNHGNTPSSSPSDWSSAVAYNSGTTYAAGNASGNLLTDAIGNLLYAP
jgi:hypothetical protein